MSKLRNYLRLIVIEIMHFVYRKVYGMNIDKSARISFGAKLDKTNPKGVHIGADTYIASGAIIFTHDYCRGLHKDTFIGERCFIGANAMVMCGLSIGNQVVIGGVA